MNSYYFQHITPIKRICEPVSKHNSECTECFFRHHLEIIGVRSNTQTKNTQCARKSIFWMLPLDVIKMIVTMSNINELVDLMHTSSIFREIVMNQLNLITECICMTKKYVRYSSECHIHLCQVVEDGIICYQKSIGITKKNNGRNIIKEGTCRDHMCAFKRCCNRRKNMSSYCYNHSCVTCDSYKPNCVVDDMYAYCAAHKCEIEGCSNSISRGKCALCNIHKTANIFVHS